MARPITKRCRFGMPESASKNQETRKGQGRCEHVVEKMDRQEESGTTVNPVYCSCLLDFESVNIVVILRIPTAQVGI